MDFDIDNLSPEDKALFDAMVKEEMMKLELEFQQQAGIKSPLNNHEEEYYQSQRDEISYKPPPRVNNNNNNNYSNNNNDYNYNDNNNYSSYKNNNHNNHNNNFDRREPPRNNNNPPRSKDIEIDIQVKGPRPKEFGNSELTRDEKRSKQLEYARQLNEQTSQAQLQSQSQNNQYNHNNHNNPKRNSQYNNEPEEQYGLQLGVDDSKDSKKSKQREYARLLEMDQRAAANSGNGGSGNNINQYQDSNQRTSLSANSRSKSNPRGVVDERRSELSSSRSDSTPRARPSGNLISGGPVLDERQAKIQKQQQYARDLQQQQNFKNAERDNLNNSPSNYKSSARINSYESNPSPSQNSKNDFGEKNLKQQKQQEYAQQLAMDQRNKEIIRNNDDNNSRNRGSGLTPRNSGLAYNAPYHSPTSDRGEYYRSPSNPLSSNQPSEKDLKLRKQQEYARQLELDKLSKEKIQVKESSRSNISNSNVQSPSNLSYQSSSSSFIGQNDYDPRQEKIQKRREQEEYARQIRDAASQQEILSPRISLAKKKSQNESRQFPSYEEDNATGLILPGANISTAIRKDNKRLQQEKYRQQLDEEQGIHPIESGRAPLYRKNKLDSDDNGHNINGLIGNHESEEEKRRKKKELQNKYFDDLSRQTQGNNNNNSNIGGVNSHYQQNHHQVQVDEPPYDPRGIVKRDNVREVRDVSPIMYPSKSNKPSQQQYSNYDYRNNDNHHDNDRDYYNDNRYNEDDDEENRSLQQLKDHASRHINPNLNNNYGGDRGYVSTAAAVAAASGSPYRGSNRPQYQNYDPRLEPEPEPYISPRQTKYPQESIPKYQKPSTSECTGLVIGGMTVLTAEQKAEKQRQQQQFVREVEEAKNAHPIHVERESYQERHRYKGNGLPGEYQGVRGASNGGGASSIQLGGGGYDRQYQQHHHQQQQQDRNDGEYRIRGTSNGGGASSISFGSDSGNTSPRQQKMQRKGKQEEYASQLRQQMNYNNANKNERY